MRRADHAGRIEVWGYQTGEARVAVAPRWHIWVGRFDALPVAGMRGVAARDPAAVEVDADLAVDDEVVADDVVVAAADERATAATHHDVFFDRVTRVAIVNVEGVCTRAVMHVVAPQQIAAAGPVLPRVECAHIARGEGDAADLVGFKDVVVAVVEHRGVGQVVQEVVGDAAAHGVAMIELSDERSHVDRRRPCLASATHVAHVVVNGEVAAGRERGPVAAGESDARLADSVDVTTLDAVVGAIDNRHGGAAEIPQQAASDRVARPARDFDAIAEAALDRKPLDADILRLAEPDQRERQVCQADAGIAIPGEWSRRPEVDHLVGEVEAPFARDIDLFEQVDGAPRFLTIAKRALGSVFRADATGNGRGVRDRAIGWIDRRDANRLRNPWHPPVSLEPDTVGHPPPTWSPLALWIGGRHERARPPLRRFARPDAAVEHLFHHGVAFVRPARQRQRRVVEIEIGQATAVGVQNRRLLERPRADGGQIDCNHVVPRGGGERIENGGVGHAADHACRNGPAGVEPCRTVGWSPNDEAVITGIEFKRLAPPVDARRQRDHQPRTGLEPWAASRLTRRIPSPLQAGKRPFQCARIGIVARRRDVPRLLGVWLGR